MSPGGTRFLQPLYDEDYDGNKLKWGAWAFDPRVAYGGLRTLTNRDGLLSREGQMFCPSFFTNLNFCKAYNMGHACTQRPPMIGDDGWHPRSGQGPTYEDYMRGEPMLCSGVHRCNFMFNTGPCLGLSCRACNHPSYV